MRIRVKVTPNAKQESLYEKSTGVFLISVREDRENGMANDKVKELIAEHYSVPYKAVRVAQGATSSSKIIEILGME
ncbi:MAG: hypothetical protein QG563_497 [Patescibacteria group bacterium]|nr:hypothetical protein [Patescibacteria group bacterium]